jgi:hypothetical protein
MKTRYALNWGVLWSTMLAIMLALIGAMVIGQTVVQLRVGVQFTPGILIGMVGSWVVMGAAAELTATWNLLNTP